MTVRRRNRKRVAIDVGQGGSEGRRRSRGSRLTGARFN